MQEKMTKFLKELYSNLGLSQEVLNSFASMAVLGLPEDADDAAIKARAQEKYVSDALKAMQVHADRRATLAKKAAEEENKGGNEQPKTPEEEQPKWVTTLTDKLMAQNEALTARIAALEGDKAKKSFDDMVSSISKELHLSASMLDLCKAGLSSDMDEKQVRDYMGSRKKTLIDNGFKFEERSSGITQNQETAEREEARKWVQEHVINS